MSHVLTRLHDRGYDCGALSKCVVQSSQKCFRLIWNHCSFLWFQSDGTAKHPQTVQPSWIQLLHCSSNLRWHRMSIILSGSPEQAQGISGALVPPRDWSLTLPLNSLVFVCNNSAFALKWCLNECGYLRLCILLCFSFLPFYLEACH